MRRITCRGVEWAVSEDRRAAFGLGPPGSGVPAHPAVDRLVFRSRTEELTLTPIPEGWRTASDADLCRYCQQASATHGSGAAPEDP